MADVIAAAEAVVDGEANRTVSQRGAVPGGLMLYAIQGMPVDFETFERIMALPTGAFDAAVDELRRSTQ